MKKIFYGQGKVKKIPQKLLSFILIATLVIPTVGALSKGTAMAADATSEKAVVGTVNEYIVQYEEQGRNTFSISPNKESQKDAKIIGKFGGSVEKISEEGTALIETEGLSPVEEKQFIGELEKLPNIRFVEKNHEVHAYGTTANNGGALLQQWQNDSMVGQQWGPAKVRAAEAWELLGENTEPVKVAVIDTGVDATHPDLQGRVIAGINLVDTNSMGQLYSAKDASDDNGHGTHVSGIIGATCGNGMGMQGVMGPANVAIIPVKVLNDEGKGTNYDVVEGIRYAADSGAKIFNMSLGSNYYSRAEAEAIAYAQSKGCVIVAAAGNDGGNVAQSYPASLPGVVAVGASDINNERAYFSNWGDRLDIAAPGVSVLSTIPKKIALKHRASGKVVYGDDAEGYYEEFNGTSMAAPHVAGAVALYKSVNVNASAMDMIEQTFKTAKDIGAIGKDEEFGRGLVDAAAMLGEEVQKTPLMLLAPSSGKELFSHVKFSVQINTNMEIARVDYYLDKLEGTPIVTVPCNQSESIYESVVDTKKIKDGSYQLIAVAKGKDGQQIGEEKSVNITILNQITDGFTLSIKNPLGQGAENAQVQVYGKAGDGTYKALRSVYSTDLGFARIKGVSNNTYETYKVVVNGRFNENNTNEDKSLFVYTKEGITLASEVEMTGAATKPLEFSMEGEVTKNLPNPYIMINPQDIKVGGMAPFKMGPQATIYLEKGEFDVKACWMPDMGVSYDQNEASYYIQKTIRVAENTTGIYIAKGDGTLVNPKFNTKNGRIKLDLQGKNGDPIPFFDGKITGNKIYIAPGTYEARAEITTENDGKITLKKSQDLVVGTDPIALPFEANLAVTKFEPATGALMEDGNTKYMYRGDVLRTEHIIGDTKGNMIENISNVYPVFSVYKIEEGLRTLIYKNSNIFQLNSGYWNSSKDFAGSVQPKTGAYEAELTFNGGEGFGGETKKTMAFELREKSGISQTDVKVTAGINSVVPAADIELYRWEEGKWVNSLEKIVTDEGGVAHIPENIKLNGEGLNVALVKFDQIKTGYEIPQEKHGFQVIPFAKLSDLTSMDVSNTVRVTVNVTDRNGNKPQNLSTPVIVPVYADCGGKLVNKEAVTEVKMNVRQAYGANELYIPAGEYPYIYSEFVLAGQNYYLRAQNFETNAGGTLPLDGKNTSALSLNFAQGLTPDILDMNPGNKMYLSYGKYQIKDYQGDMNLYITKGTYNPHVLASFQENATERVTISLANGTMNMNEDRSLLVGAEFTPTIQLNESAVKGTGQVTASVNLADENGNQIVRIEEEKGGIYKRILPKLFIGTNGKETVVAQNDMGDYTTIKIPVTYYTKGSNTVYVQYVVKGQVKNSKKATFTYDDTGVDAKLTVEEKNFYQQEVNGDGSVTVTMNQGVRGQKEISVKAKPSSIRQTVVFEQFREGVLVARIYVQDVFKEDLQAKVKMNVLPGDKILVTCN